MTITYEMDGNLYVNVTNRCPNRCEFCIRSVPDAFTENLWLEREPTVDEISKDILERDLLRYQEIVFCGFGEPFERIEDILAVCQRVKKFSDIPIRINTNGLGNLIAGEDVTPYLEGWVDSISISLNAKNAQEYDEICHSVYGKRAFTGLLEFALRCRSYVPEVVFTVVDCMPGETIEACRAIAERAKIPLRVRREVK